MNRKEAFDMEWTPLPIGVENYEEIIEKGYYYVDKTLLIKDLIDLRGKVNLFTWPRRFGKTLNMSMLRYFFENLMKTVRICLPERKSWLPVQNIQKSRDNTP